MLFKYKIIDKDGIEKAGDIDAISEEAAISSLQGREYVITYIEPAEKKNLLNLEFTFLQKVSNKDVVILSKQLSTLFSSHVSALRVFRLLGNESENPALRRVLTAVADDVQGGLQISVALAKHPKVFSSFYVNMIKSGEESGKLNETFSFLADHLDRNYDLLSKVKNALIYPIFVIVVFVVVMVMMFTMVIPKISVILIDGGQELPTITRAVISMSDFLLDYGIFILVFLVIGIFMFLRFARTKAGKLSVDKFKLGIPYIGDLYKKVFLARILGNMQTMLTSGVSIIKTMEVTSTVVDSVVYQAILEKSVEAIKAGVSVSDSLSGYEEIPNIMVQMIKIGEETGEFNNVLDTLSRFYEREVNGAVDMLVGMIEPAMIVLLGLGVGGLMAAVLMPIYNISSAI
ncbi:MAG: type II secretion system F family protein [Candidatus Pacebacteria bacterium]|nr:type II secretion system F family protein [Candidatus Paceibacterota bacterium]